MKTNKLTNNLLKFGIFLFGISLLLWNCEKDESISEFKQSKITLHKTKEIFNSNFNKDAFSNLKNEPIWESAKTYLVNNKKYIEIPFTDVSKINLKKSTSVSIDKLLAFISPDGKPTLNVVHYFAQDIKNNLPDFNKLLYFNLNNFNGFATLYDLNKNVIKSNKYSSGVKSDYQYTVKNTKKNEGHIFNRMPENCETHTETIVTETCWFWYYHDSGRVEIIDCFYDYEYTTYQTCENENEGGGGGGTTVITKEIEVEINNELDNPCAHNIFENLLAGIYKTNPLKPEVKVLEDDINLSFSESILKLFEESNKTKYTIEDRDLSNSNGHTIGTTTTLDNNYLNTATTLSIARTMIHEQIHAYLNAVFFNYTNFENKPFREKMWEYSKNKGYTDYSKFQHEFMGQFVNAMAYSLYKWDKDYGAGGNLGWSYYKAMAFGGLFHTDPNGELTTSTDTFKELVPEENRQSVADIVFNETKGNNDAKGTKCN